MWAASPTWRVTGRWCCWAWRPSCWCATTRARGRCPQGFWESMAEPTVLQHRVFVLLVVLFGLFEWTVRTRRLRSPRWALVFPLLCAVGGGLLLTHSHASLNLKSEFLLEVTHAPLGGIGRAHV